MGAVVSFPGGVADTLLAAADTAGAAALALPPVVRLAAHPGALAAPLVVHATPVVNDYDALWPPHVLRRVRVLPVPPPSPTPAY